MAFTEFDPTVNSVEDLVDAILAPGATLTPKPGSINFAGAVVPDSPTVGETSLFGIGQTSFYDGSLDLGFASIDSGILLTSGDGSPPEENTFSSYGEHQLGNTDADLQTVANSAFAGAGTVQDANILEFKFDIKNPSVKSISFDLVFGSDEFPEFSDSSFVDVAGVFVNGTNVALFNNDLTQPLSVISKNLTLGNFINNDTASFFPIEYDTASILPIEYDTDSILPIEYDIDSFFPIEDDTDSFFPIEDDTDSFFPIEDDTASILPIEDDTASILPIEDDTASILPIEYDGVSSVLSIIAPVEPGENTLKFAVGDTGDQVLDSGLFIANLDTSTLDVGGVSSSGGGSGILISVTEPNSDNILASGDLTVALAEFFKAGDTDDVVNAGPGNDVVDTGLGDDVINAGPGDDVVDAGPGNDVVNAGPGNDSATTGLGNDKLRGSDDDDTLKGGPGQDTLSGGNGEDDLRGGGDNDKLMGNADADILQGNSGNDILLGGTGDDTLLGGIGRDRLNGGPGNDVLTGNASIDRFIFNSNKAFNRNDFGIDEVTDFSQGARDIIILDLDSFTAINSESGRGFSIATEFDTVNSDEDAATADAVIVYNESNGNLFYNPNGSAPNFGSGGQFATLTASPSLDAEDFFLR
ncbi:choice-of-anchor L domain-containing protein [Okeania sp.]|uniref:choice-of-anchor L domain-containing protein n=1 Tax=Okeania sp. TaxID=3100323 RepID=UPI002B4B86DB|nr:choice-of-anchor L domain-containing protein [Okeania sp.]MEB3340654.1 choice-of-anchor L domain-containing protein [Okeania sp.]